MEQMYILVACEESQRVCKAFRDKGHLAFSCDIIDASGGYPEWHIKQDVLPLLNGFCSFTTCDGTEHKLEQKWDMIISFPPCTHLAVSGARHFEKKREDGRQEEAIKFFCEFLKADCEKIIVENPVGIISGDYIKKYFPELCKEYGLPKKPTQIIHPWMFGDNYKKQTCLWIKGIEPLKPLVTVEPQTDYIEWVDKNGKIKRQERWYYEALKLSPEERAKVRSKTFPGVADAMADQWG